MAAPCLSAMPLSVGERGWLVMIRGSVSAGAARGLRSARVAGWSRGYARKVLGENQVERPIERDADFLFKARQLAQVDRPPQPPRDEARKFYAEDVRDSRPATD